MKKPNKKNRGGVVYSTNPDLRVPDDLEEDSSILPAQQVLRIWLEKKGRGGKEASVVKGFEGSTAELEMLASALKKYCGTGGAAKDNMIIIQGDQRQKMLEFLLKEGYRKTKLAGG